MNKAAGMRRAYSRMLINRSKQMHKDISAFRSWFTSQDVELDDRLAFELYKHGRRSGEGFCAGKALTYLPPENVVRGMYARFKGDFCGDPKACSQVWGEGFLEACRESMPKKSLRRLVRRSR